MIAAGSNHFPRLNDTGNFGPAFTKRTVSFSLALFLTRLNVEMCRSRSSARCLFGIVHLGMLSCASLIAMRVLDYPNLLIAVTLHEPEIEELRPDHDRDRLGN